ncbi:MAG: SDR family NAD(P)-dependent oxidoreductase [Acholeplasmataceae bacterium]|nr:SDR family NAD(P)-dependent oxidoreductase [Acholeplasmataceae bacterium]
MKRLSVVTGATAGIGYEVMVQLLDQGVSVIAVGRNIDKLNRIKEQFKEEINTQKLTLIQGDLSYHQGCMDVSNKIIEVINQFGGTLDLLIHVAGIVKSGYSENRDHQELTFATNHLSVYLLTGKLYGFLKKSIDPRILIVSSLSHYRAWFDKTNLQSKRCYNVLRGYQRSKLYNVLFSYRFHRMDKDIKIYAIDPGVVKTEIGDKNTKGLALFVWKIRKKSGVDAKLPAQQMVQIALDEKYIKDNGGYMKNGESVKSSRITYQIKKQDYLWKESEKLTNFVYPFDEVSIEKS